MGLDPSADGQDRDRGADEEATAGDIFSQEPGERRDRVPWGARGDEAAWVWDRAFVGCGFFFLAFFFGRGWKKRWEDFR